MEINAAVGHYKWDYCRQSEHLISYVSWVGFSLITAFCQGKHETCVTKYSYTVYVGLLFVDNSNSKFDFLGLLIFLCIQLNLKNAEVNHVQADY